MDRSKRIQIVRESIVKIAKILTDGQVQVTQAGVKAFVTYDEKTLKPLRVNLPMLPDDASEALIDAVQGFLDSEVSKVLYADSRSALRAKYEQLDGIYKPVESLFCEDQMVKAFPGSRNNLGNMHQAFIDRFIEPKLKEAIANGASEQELFQILAIPALRAWGGQKFFQDYMSDKWSLIAGIQKELDPIASKMAGIKKPEDCYEMAKQIRNVVMGEPPEGDGHNPFGEKSKNGGSRAPGGGGTSPGRGKSPLSDEEEASGGGGSDLESDEEPEDEPLGGGAGAGADEDDESEDESPEEGDDAEDDPTPEENEAEAPEPGEKEDKEPNESGRNGDGFTEQRDSPQLEEDEQVKQDEYGGKSILNGMDFDQIQDISDEFGQYVTELCSSEMDEAEYTVFTREWDKIAPPPIPAGYSPAWMTAMESQISAMVGPVARGLERAFAARNKSLQQRGLTRGKLDTGNLSRLAAGDDRIFKRKIEHRTRDVAVELVVDCSGSMGGSKIQTAMATAWIMAEVLQKLGISHEIIGFTTGWMQDQRDRDLWDEYQDGVRAGRHFDRAEPLHYPIFKSFDERFGIEQKKRMCSFPYVRGAMSGNCDGESVQYAYERLCKAALKGKPKGRMMIVLSDGMPACGVDGYKLNAHLKHVVNRIEADGVNIVGIGIMSDSVSQFYRKNIKLDNVEELPGLILNQLRDVLLAS